MLAVILIGPTRIAAADDLSAENRLRIAANDGDSVAVVVFAEISVDEYAIANGLPVARWVNIPHSSSVQLPDGCGGTAHSVSMYGFCRLDSTVYIGIDMAQRLNDKSFYLAAAIGIAHEFGHHLQQLQGTSNGPESAENGADCVAGAWLAWFNEYAYQKLSLDDIVGIGRLVKLISRRYPGDPHGTNFDRGFAITRGFIGGLRTCNVYTPTI